MSIGSTLLARRWRNLQVAFAVALAVVLIARVANINGYVSQVIVKAAYTPFNLLRVSVVQLGQKADELQQLRQKLVEASVRLSMLEEAERENLRLRSVLGFEAPAGYKIVPAKVIAVYGEPLPTSALINKGRQDSVFVDQSVINQDGLVGRVIAVSADFATVQLLTDPLNRVAARDAASREMGIVKFLTLGGMIMDNFPILGNIEVGDEILSSGLGGGYPPGLTVGTVMSVERPPGQYFCDIRLEPAVNFYSIEELFVLRPGSL
jgi:rod shape-determining protein MreC